MTDVTICPEDGKVCEMRDEDKQGQGCWFCPKIRNILKAEVSESGEGDKGETKNG